MFTDKKYFGIYIYYS